MNKLKRIRLALTQLAKQAWSLPQSVAHAAKQRQRQLILNEREAERLDRILKPWKYLGK